MANGMTPEQKLALVKIKVEELNGLSGRKRRRRRRAMMQQPAEQPQSGSINVVTTAPVQSFVQSILPSGMPVPPPVVATAPATPAAPAAPAEDPKVALAKKQLEDLKAQQAAGKIQFGAVPAEGCPPGTETRTLADGTKVCVRDMTNYLLAKQQLDELTAQQAAGRIRFGGMPAGGCPAGFATRVLADGTQLCVQDLSTVVTAPTAPPPPPVAPLDPYATGSPPVATPPPVVAPPVAAPPSAPPTGGGAGGGGGGGGGGWGGGGGGGGDPWGDSTSSDEEQPSLPALPPPPPPPAGPAPVWYVVGGLALLGVGGAVWYFMKKQSAAVVKPEAQPK